MSVVSTTPLVDRKCSIVNGAAAAGPSFLTVKVSDTSLPTGASCGVATWLVMRRLQAEGSDTTTDHTCECSIAWPGSTRTSVVLSCTRTTSVCVPIASAFESSTTLVPVWPAIVALSSDQVIAGLLPGGTRLVNEKVCGFGRSSSTLDVAGCGDSIASTLLWIARVICSRHT